MNRKISITLALIVALALGGCNNARQKGNQKSSENKKEVIKIGAILPLTGHFAEMSLPIKYAMDIAVDEVNKKGGINGKTLQIVYGDSNGDAKNGVSSALRIIQKDNIKIITTFLTSVSESVKPITEQRNILLLAQTVSPTILENSKYIIRFHYNFIKEGKIISNYIIKSGVKNVVYIQSNDPSDNYKMENVIITKLKKNSIQLKRFKFNVGTKDFSGIVLKAMHERPNLLCMDGYGTDIFRILKEINKYNLKNVKLLGNIGFIELPENTNEKLYQQFIFTIPSFLVENTNRIKIFRKKYQEKTDLTRIGYAAYYAYDMIKLLSEALKRTADNEQIKKIFIGKHIGVTGNYTINEKGDYISNIKFARYLNDSLVEIK